MSTASLVAPMAEDVPRNVRFARLLEAHGASVRRVARVYARGPAEQADLEQDIALALYRALPAFRGDCSERTFVFRVAHNRGISHAETERPRARREALVDEAGTLPDPRPLADEALDQARRRAALWAAIGELPVGARSVLTLALEGLSHEEIADVLGSTANSVAVRLSRARAELSKLLGGRR